MPKQSLNIGLDIGNFSLKAVILERVADKIHLRQLVIAEQLKGIDREDISPTSFIAKTLKDNIHLPSGSKASVTLSLSGPYIRLKKASQMIISSRIDGAFDHAVWSRPDIVEDVPFKPTVDYWVLSDKIKQGAPIDIMAVCANEQLISKTVISLQEIGFTVLGIEIDHTAILRSMEYCGILKGEKKDFIFLDIGAKFSKMGIVRNNKIVLVKDMMVGGNNLTATLASNLNISLEDAEKKKKKLNFFQV